MGYESDPHGLAALLAECLAAPSLAIPGAPPPVSLKHWETFAERTQPLIASAVVRGLRQFGATPTRELVDDLVQDTYVKLCADNLAALRRVRGERPEALIAYLKITATNVARDHARAVLAEKRGSGRVEAPGDEVLARAADPATEGESADRQILLDQIDRCLAASGDPGQRVRDRSIFWLYYRHGLTARAIAAIPSIGLTAKGVESTIYRLTRTVRAVFEEREGKPIEKASF